MVFSSRGLRVFVVDDNREGKGRKRGRRDYGGGEWKKVEDQLIRGCGLIYQMVVNWLNCGASQNFMTGRDKSHIDRGSSSR